MLLFPAYKLADVLDMYTSAFFQLYEEGNRLQAAEYKMLASIASVPHMADDDRATFIANLDRAATDPRDILIEDEDYSDIAKLKDLLEE